MRALRAIGGGTSRTDYAGNRVYENGRLAKILTEEDYIDFTGSTPVYRYFLTDHLGNNRVVMNQDGRVEQVNHYYPFGSLMAESTGAEVQPWKFGGKELDTKKGVNWADFGMRYYGSSLGRWSSIDPLAEKYYSWSPYTYCANNPTKYLDMNGDSISLAGMQRLDQALNTNYTQTIVNDLQSQTGLTMTVSADGKMTYAKNSDGQPIIATTTDTNGKIVQAGSATARNLMIGAMDHQDMVTILPGARSGVPTGSNTIGLNFKQIEEFANGTIGMDNQTLGWGMTVMHELYHTQVGGGLADKPGNPGPVVTQMNIIRNELNALGGNYGQRLDYYATPIGGKVFIPFNRSAKESIIVGLHPSTVRQGQQYIKF